MAEQKPINVYGNFKTPAEIEQDRIHKVMGVVRYHETTYLEYEIPESLEDELSAMIEKKLSEFYQTCQCEDCKEQRNTPQ